MIPKVKETEVVTPIINSKPSVTIDISQDPKKVTPIITNPPVLELYPTIRTGGEYSFTLLMIGLLIILNLFALKKFKSQF